MEPVEFRDMEYVMAVHEEQSFSGAARKHFISPPVLSRVVRKVERNLGVTLFDRSSIPLKPTPQGQKVLEYFEQMQKLRMELEQYCETAGQQGGPGLTVAAPSFFCTYGLPPVIAAFKERYPDWEIRLVEANDRDLVDFLRAGVAELGISANGDIRLFYENVFLLHLFSQSDELQSFLVRKAWRGHPKNSKGQLPQESCPLLRLIFAYKRPH